MKTGKNKKNDNILSDFIENLKLKIPANEHGEYLLDNYENLKHYENSSSSFSSLYNVLTLQEILDFLHMNNFVIPISLEKEYNMSKIDILKQFLPKDLPVFTNRELIDYLIKNGEDIPKIQQDFPQLFE